MLLPGLLSLVSLSLLIPSALATCTNFTADRLSHGGTSFTIPSSESLRLSAVINCSDPSTFDPVAIEGPTPITLHFSCNNTQCQLYTPEYYQIRVNRTLNITTGDIKVEDGIFELIDGLGYFGRPDSTSLNQSWVYHSPAISTCLEKGQAGWWGFTSTLRCVDGVLSGCNSTGGGPADGTSVRACGVALTNDIVEGTVDFVTGTGVENEAAPPNATLTDQDKDRKDDGRANDAGVLRWSSSAVILSVIAVGFGMML